MRSPSTATAAASFTSARVAAGKPRTARTPRAYLRQLTLARWHSVAEWEALVAIVTPESHFDPCAVFPSRHECGYDGPSSCGIPQAQPCPSAWRGRLAASWREQVRWLVDYVGRRYGDPFGALAFRRANGWY